MRVDYEKLNKLSNDLEVIEKKLIKREKRQRVEKKYIEEGKKLKANKEKELKEKSKKLKANKEKELKKKDENKKYKKKKDRNNEYTQIKLDI